jgi:hypothetical protein
VPFGPPDGQRLRLGVFREEPVRVEQQAIADRDDRDDDGDRGGDNLQDPTAHCRPTLNQNTQKGGEP